MPQSTIKALTVTPAKPVRLREKKAVEGQVVSSPSGFQITGNLLSDLKSIVAQLEREQMAGQSVSFSISRNSVQYEFNVWLKR